MAEESVVRGIEEILLGQTARYTQAEIAAAAGLPVEYAEKVWRAMGFPAVPPDVAAFTDEDKDSLCEIKGLLGEDLIDEEVVLHLSRAVGQTMGRLANWVGDTLTLRLAGDLRPAGEPLPDELTLAAIEQVKGLLPPFERLLVQGWRRQITAYGLRTMALVSSSDPVAGTALLAVGFTDLVSFTRLSRSMDPLELAALVDRFEVMVGEVATDLGGRTVKTLGDEVLFCAERPQVAAEIALRIADRSGDGLPEVRTGVAYGEVVLRLGDVFGTTVNRASRLTAVAHPGTVIIDTALGKELMDEEEYRTSPLRPRVLQGLGKVRPVSLRRSR